MSKVDLKLSDFVHLHNHTQYSLLDGLTKVPALVEKVDSLGMRAVAMTDHGTMSGVIEFYKKCKELNIKPIIGMETYIANRKHTDKDPATDKPNFHLTLIAMNNQGYLNLMRLSTIANLEGYYYRPRIDHELLEKYNEGIIVLSGCIGGEVGDALRQDQYETAKKLAKWYKKVFGDRYYIELQDHGHPEHDNKWDEQVVVTEKSIKLAKELNIPTVVTCDAHYLNHEDQEAHEILLCVQTGSFLSDKDRMSLKEFDLSVTDPKEVIKRWSKDNPDAVVNTRKIADRCDIDIELGKILIPKFPLQRGITEKSHLTKLVYQGLSWRYGGKSYEESKHLSIEEAKESLNMEIKIRAEYELSVVNEMSFNGYFLIIADFVNWGKDKGIVFGPGRGSAAGSIISYALRITELDPLKYDLLFERFLNPDRISMPDIDIDIQDSRRDEVIQYCVDKYGEERVANIVTFGRMAARNAVRDVARVLQVPYAEADRLAKMIPPPVQGRHIPLKTSLEEDNDLKNEYKDNEQSKRVFDLAVQMEGTIRSHGVHAAGVVIAPSDIVTYAPLEKAQKGVIATQYSMGPIEELGLLKMDFLGLSNLTIIKNALRIVKKVYGTDIDIAELALDDKKTFELLAKGETTGVFQLESSGMKRYLKELKPSEFEDIVAMVALYRPGPLTAGLTDSFVARKNGREEVTYDHPLMKNALKNTYGVLVYQEQVMQIVKEMCGFSGGESDTLRKAVGKKNREMMAKMKDKVIKGAIKNNVEQKIAEKFWEDLEGFADYAFNKSHAACYGLIAYQTAFLKTHYPDAFMAALMTSDFDNTDRLAIEIEECKKLDIDVLPPSVNESYGEFSVIPGAGKIRFGLHAVKNVGGNAVDEILNAREEEKFSSIENFLTRVNSRQVNRKTIESLIKAGAFDEFGQRSTIYSNLENIMAYASRRQKQVDSGQTDLFGNEVSGESASPSLVLVADVEQFTLHEQLQWERELLGIYLSHHPLDHYATALSNLSITIKDALAQNTDKTITLGGIINDAKEISTKNGQKMAFIQFADIYDDIELVVFPDIYSKYIDLWQKDKVLLVKGKLSSRGKAASEDKKLIVSSGRELTLEEAKKTKTPRKAKKLAEAEKAKSPEEPKNERLYIRLRSSEDQQLLIDLKKIIDENSGPMEVVLVVGKTNKQVIKLPATVKRTDEVQFALGQIVGSENVVVQ